MQDRVGLLRLFARLCFAMVQVEVNAGEGEDEQERDAEPRGGETAPTSRKTKTPTVQHVEKHIQICLQKKPGLLATGSWTSASDGRRADGSRSDNSGMVV